MQTPDSKLAGLQTEAFGLLVEPLLSKNPRVALEQRRAITEALSDTLGQVIATTAPPVVVEIGAHEAQFSRQTKQANPGARVIAFEAHPGVYRRYEEVCRLAGIEYNHLCVSAVDAPQKLLVPKKAGRERLTMGSMLADRYAQELVSYEVPGVSLDSFLGEDRYKPNVIWVDVEGAAMQVIEGARQTLESCLAFHVEAESRERWKGQPRAADLINVLGEFGLVPVLRDVQKAYQFNILFLRSSLLAQAPGLMRTYLLSVAAVLK
jgi:FkbM family methyltransferase